MPASEGISLLSYAFEKETDDKLFTRWVGLAQYYIGFDEFKRRLQPAVVNEKKTLERLDDIMDSSKWEKVQIRSK